MSSVIDGSRHITTWKCAAFLAKKNQNVHENKLMDNINEFELITEYLHIDK